MKDLKVTFLLENKSGNRKLYEREAELLPFYKEVLDDEKTSFYYHLKDSAINIEEKLIHRINGGNDGEKIGEIFFKVLYGEKVLFSYEIDSNNLTYNDFKKKDVDVFYFMETIIGKFQREIMDEHKKFILYRSE